MAHQAEELGPQPLQLLQGRQVLQGDDHRGHRAVRRVNRRGVDQHRDAASVGHGDHDLLGAHGLGGAEGPGQGDLGQGHLPSVGPAEGERVQELLQFGPRLPQDFQHPAGLPVDVQRRPGAGVEDHHAHRRGVDQGFQVDPGRLLATAAGLRLLHRFITVQKLPPKCHRKRLQVHRLLTVALLKFPPVIGRPDIFTACIRHWQDSKADRFRIRKRIATV